MKKNASIEQIVQELCDMEPSLGSRREELRRIVETLLEQKPANTFDKAFARRLRRQLMTVDQPSLSFIASLMTVFTSNRLTYGFSGALVALVLMLPVVYLASTPARNSGTLSSISPLVNTPIFSSKSSNAFGSLAKLAEAQRNQSGGGGMGGGGGIAPAMGGDAIRSDLSIRPWYQPYKFVYKGDALTIKDTELNVHKRVKRLSSSDLSGLANVGGGLLSIGSFINPQVRSIDLYEDRDGGYNIGVNFFEGTVYVNPNYDTWFAEQNAACARGNCPPPVGINEVLSDSELISIASDFLAQHGIDASAYGAPVVDSQWRVAYDQTTDKSMAYVPETQGVVYPIRLQGQEVRDSGGNLFGLRVDVHVRQKKVFSVWNLNTQRYESSAYATEQDTARILKIAEQGGMFGWYGGIDSPDAKEIALGTPTETLMQFVRYENGLNEELYVPALVFPVLDAPSDYYGQRSIVVPMIKEILDSYQQTVIMPLLKEGPTSVDPVAPTDLPASEPAR